CHTASRVATSAVAWATAALRAISSAWRPLRAVTPIARPIPTSTPRPNCHFIGTCPEEDTDCAFFAPANFAIGAVLATGPERPHLLVLNDGRSEYPPGIQSLTAR